MYNRILYERKSQSLLLRDKVTVDMMQVEIFVITDIIFSLHCFSRQLVSIDFIISKNFSGIIQITCVQVELSFTSFLSSECKFLFNNGSHGRRQELLQVQGLTVLVLVGTNTVSSLGTLLLLLPGMVTYTPFNIVKGRGPPRWKERRTNYTSYIHTIRDLE